MKISKYFLMGAVAMSLFACSNDDDLKVNEKGDNMTLITLSLGKASTRSLEETAGDKHNFITDLRFEFFTADGRNLNVPQPVLKSTEEGNSFDHLATLNGGTHQVTIAIQDVPLTARRIVAIANEASTTIETATFTDALKSTVNLVDMYDGSATPFGQAKSTLTGRADVAPGTEGGTVNVSIDLTPVSSRVEIAKLTAVKQPGTDESLVNIKDFDLCGIFMNQFYTEGALDPTYNASDRNKIAHGSKVEEYNFKTYNDAKFGFMCDDYHTTNNNIVTVNYNGEATSIAAEGQTTETTPRTYIWQVAPTETTDWWGYPVLAGDGKPLDDDFNNDVAHIVLKLYVSYDKDMVLTKDDGTTETIVAGTKRVKYLTVTGYKQGNTSIAKFERGKVYRIENFEFDINDLTEVPYEGNKTVNATVKVLAWVPVPVTPEIQ